MNEQERQDRLTALQERFTILARRHMTIMERPPAYVRGEQIAKGVIDNFKALTTSSMGRPVFVHVFDDIGAFTGEDVLLPSSVCATRCAITCAAVGDPPLPAGMPSMVTVKRPCFHDEKGQWIAWMRKDMPDGVINPDVAVYYEAQGIDRGPWELRRTEDEIEDLKREWNALALNPQKPEPPASPGNLG